MLGSFWNSRRDTSGGDTTPKAPVHSNPDRERNPFESSLGSNSTGGAAARHSRENSSSLAASTTTSSNNGTNAKDFANPSVPLLHSSLNSSTSSLSSSHSSTSNSHHGLASGHHGLPAGLRTPTLQKSFVLPEVTSSVNATGLHAPNTSSKTATAALHQSPMYPQSSAVATSNSNSSGRNTPTRTAHQHTQTAPYPNPKEHHNNLNNTSPKSKQHHPEFKLSQPPDSKSASPKNKLPSDIQFSNAPSTPVNQTFPSSSTSSAPSTGEQASTSDGQRSSNMTSSSGSSGGSSTTGTLQSSARKRENHGSSSLKGKLTVKIIEARNLVTPEANVRPYVVATFEQNEFVSREAINEHEEDARGEPVSPRTSSHLRSSQRAGGPNGNGAATGNGNSASEGGENMDTSTASAYNPVWKHEVAL